MMAEAPAFITMPHGKKNKVKVTNAAMVLSSLAPTLPIVVPEATTHLEDSTKSAPNSPERDGRKKGLFKKHLPRPRSPFRRHHRASLSDPESQSSASPSPQSRPRWLPFKSKKKKSPDLNGTPVEQPDFVSSSDSPEATPVDQLPGQSSSNVPEIRVSSESHEADGGQTVSYEDFGGNLDPCRKNSQSSRCSSGSGLMSVGTSGFGSLLSPSGDESYSGSDLESPLSPYSEVSSFTDETPGDISDLDSIGNLDPIDRDFLRRKSSSLSAGSIDNLSVTTPTPTSESPPDVLDSSVNTLVSPTSPDGKEVKEPKKKRERNSRVSQWRIYSEWSTPLFKF